jgi:hypothetical protein
MVKADFLGGSGIAGPKPRPRHIQVRQVHADFKLQLVVVGLHVGAEFVKSLVMLAFFYVGQFVHGDHLQKFRRCVLEQGGDADFTLGFEFAALHAGDGGVGAQRVGDHLQFAVKGDFVERLCPAQVLKFEVLNVVKQCFVCANTVTVGVSFQKPLAQTLVRDELRDLRQCVGAVALQEFQRHRRD